MVLAHGHQEEHRLALPLHVHEVVPRARGRVVEEALAAQHARRRRAAPRRLGHLVVLRQREHHALAPHEAGTGGALRHRRRRRRLARRRRRELAPVGVAGGHHFHLTVDRRTMYPGFELHGRGLDICWVWVPAFVDPESVPSLRTMCGRVSS